MQTIEVRLSEDDEQIQGIPKLVEQYLEAKERCSEGKNFRVVIADKSCPTADAGIAYSNELLVEKRQNGVWTKLYSTGMLQYRGAYAYERDDKDLRFLRPMILDESEDEVTYAIATGEGNVKVFRIRGKRPKQLESFGHRQYQETVARKELQSRILDDADAFCAYVEKLLGDRWYVPKCALPGISCCIFDECGAPIENDYPITRDEITAMTRIMVLLAKHPDREYDAIVDVYRFFVWVKGHGFGSSEELPSGLCHPDGSFYYVGLDFKLKNLEIGGNSISFTADFHSRPDFSPTLNRWGELVTRQANRVYLGSEVFRAEWKVTDERKENDS